MTAPAPPQITVVDYGMGNVGSIISMARKIGASAVLTSDHDAIAAANRLVLPGVGAFDHGIRQLKDRGLFDTVRAKARTGSPFLGICLGMQLLSSGSDEGSESGLELISGTCRRFKLPAESPLKVPHVGWNEITVRKDNPLVQSAGPRQRFYFTHSYHFDCADAGDVVATADYGYEFPAVIQHANVIGVQFHPEKSHRFGMELFRRFVSLS